MMAAQQYYVENGPNLDPRLLSIVLPNYIPDHFLKSSGDKGLSRWEKLVADAFQKVNMRHILSALNKLDFDALYIDLNCYFTCTFV
jgi:hypothetical protein